MSQDASPVGSPVIAGTAYGKVRGKQMGGVSIFRGIP
jgi:hypothetical protein